jgi:L-asparaginase/Glu-tRNA(Gln) amidotransferase subunit D
MYRMLHQPPVAVLLIFSVVGHFSPRIAAADRELPICQLVATGGTIAMKIDPAKNAPVPALSGEDLVAVVPELAKVANIRVESRVWAGGRG